MIYECPSCGIKVEIADDELPIEHPNCVECSYVMKEAGSIYCEHGFYICFTCNHRTGEVDSLE